jgi:hypothetical protein
MALAVVRNAYGGADANGLTHDLAQAATPAIGNLLVVHCRWNSNTVTVTLSETEANPDNTYTDSGNGTVDNGATLRGQTHYVASIDATGAITTRWTSSGNVVTHRAGVEISGHDTATPIDQFAEGTGTSSAINQTQSGPAVTTTVANTLVLCFFGSASNDTFTQVGSWTKLTVEAARLVAVYQIFSATGTYTPQVQFAATGNAWEAQTVAIAQAASTTVRPRSLAMTGVGS